MSVVIASKTRYTGTAKPPDLNIETKVVEIGAQGDDYLVEGYVDLSQLESGDKATLCEYIAVDGSNYRRFICVDYSGPVSEPVIRFHTKTLLNHMRYRVTVTQTDGTVRSFPYGFILEVMGTL